jgi:hypothetical protein
MFYVPSLKVSVALLALVLSIREALVSNLRPEADYFEVSRDFHQTLQVVAATFSYNRSCTFLPRQLLTHSYLTVRYSSNLSSLEGINASFYNLSNDI